MKELPATYWLTELLDVKALDVSVSENDEFLGHRLPSSTGRVFGGKVSCLALIAASKTVSAG